MDARLLRLLDAVLDEVHLARAAARVGWPLPAAASALERCRQLLRDPLLEDGGTQMRLTAKAQALRETVRQMLAGDADAPAASHAAGHRKPVRSACASSCRTIRRRWWRMRCIRNWPSRAPLDLEFQTWLGDADAAARLERGQTDLVLGSAAPSQQVRGREVLQERCVAVMRRDHPAAHSADAGALAGVSAPADRLPRQPQPHDRRAGRHAGPAPPHRHGDPEFPDGAGPVAGSDLIAVMPMHCVPAATAAHPVALACLRPPLPLEAPPLRLLQHRRHAEDAPWRWWRRCWNASCGSADGR
jgi:DNA-binding transcriptional LysR family regulator